MSEGTSSQITERYTLFREAKAAVDRVRGEFLSVVIRLEQQIDATLLYYFRPDESSWSTSSPR